jgi:predicted TIM-barrel enzyme
MDVNCTSGPGTGQQADPEKVATMRAAVGHGAAIALASGVTADNVHHYLPYVNAYLVGTGIEHAFGVLDPGKTAALQAAIASYGSGTQPMQPSSDAR